MSAAEISVVNLNTWIGLLVRGALGVELIEPEGHKEARQRALIEGLRELRPDVVTLQECLPLPTYAVTVAEELGYDCLWRVANSGLRLLGAGLPWGMGRGEGLAILARRELSLTALGARRLSGRGLVTNWISLQLGPMRYALAGRVLIDGRPVIVAVTHIRYGFPNEKAFYQGWAELRRRGTVDGHDPPDWLMRLTRKNRKLRDIEIRRLATWLGDLSASLGGAPVLLGADFNLDPGQPQLDGFLETTGFDNLLPRLCPGALTWDPARNYNIGYGTVYSWADGTPKPVILQLMAYLDAIPQCPDHVMTSPGLEGVTASLCLDEPRDGILPSDHFGVWARARLR